MWLWHGKVYTYVYMTYTERRRSLDKERMPCFVLAACGWASVQPTECMLLLSENNRDELIAAYLCVIRLTKDTCI